MPLLKLKIVSNISNSTKSSTTDLDYDHSERENISFLAVSSLLVQNFWGSPSHGVASAARGTPCWIWAVGDCGKTEIRDPCAAGDIDEDVWLEMCQ